MSLFDELSRRGVIRAAAMYIAVAWGGTEILVFLAEALWSEQDAAPIRKYLAIAFVAGFPAVVYLSWARDLGRRSRRFAAAGAIAITLIGLLVWISPDRATPMPDLLSDTQHRQLTGIDARSIAVLPFISIGNASENTYFGEGIAEELLNLLARVPNLKVTSRTSSFQLARKDMALPQIALALGVRHILEGSVRRSGKRLRITAQLIDAATDRHVWSETYDRELTDIFEVQDDIASSITQSLQLEIDNIAPTTVTTASSLAYDLFLKGRAALHTRSEESIREAMNYFREALANDATFAPAHAGLAQLHVISPVYLQVPRDVANSRARTASATALRLDPNNVDALLVSAVLAGESGDFLQSVELFQLALRLKPGNAQAHQWHGEAMAQLGFPSAARHSLRKALELNPLAGSTNTVRAKVAAYFTDDEMLFEAARQADAFGARMAPMFLALHYFRIGDVARFGSEIARLYEVVDVDARAAKLITSAAAGEISNADLITELDTLGLRQSPLIARELALLGLHRDAMRAMFRDNAIHTSYASDVWLPENYELRALPEFPEFTKTLGWVDYWRTNGLPEVCTASEPEAFCAEVLL
jgi:TolB-like protein